MLNDFVAHFQFYICSSLLLSLGQKNKNLTSFPLTFVQLFPLVNSCLHRGSGSVTDTGLSSLLVRHLTGSCQKITTKKVAEHRDKIYFEAAHSLMTRMQFVNYRLFAFIFIVRWDFPVETPFFCWDFSNLRFSLDWQKGCHVDWSGWHGYPEV